MICSESNSYLERNFIYFTRTPVQEDLEEGIDELQGCCGQLLVTNRECEHTLCDGAEEPYRVGGLSIELEKYPHPGCGGQFYSSPTQNLQHQDSVHCGVLAYVCGACRGIYVSEGAFVHHIIHRHNGSARFERDMNIRHRERCHTRVSYTY